MKLVFNNPMTELLQLIAAAESQKDVSISITKSEMSSIIKHPNSPKLFPSYFTRYATRKQHITLKMNEIKKKLNSPSLLEADMQIHWDEQTRLERQMRNLEDEVPTELRTESGIDIRVSIIA